MDHQNHEPHNDEQDWKLEVEPKANKQNLSPHRRDKARGNHKEDKPSNIVALQQNQQKLAVTDEGKK